MAHEITYDYVEHVAPNLICVICQSALVDPVTTTSCKHTFCQDCITQAINHNPQCPIDRSALTMRSLRDTEQLVNLGCGTVLQRGLLLAHFRTCPKAIVTCQDGDCGLSEDGVHKMWHITSIQRSNEEELDRMREHLKRMEGNVEGLGHMRRETGDDWRWREAGLMRLGDTPSPAIPSNDNPNSQIPPIFSSSPSTPTPSHPSPQPSISSVSPRNASNLGWEEVTNGLKALMIQLASALDNMERRNEVRTMRESLRVLEEPNLAPALNQQTPIAPPSITDQSTAEQRSQLGGESPSVSRDQGDSGRETGSITESVVFSAQDHPSSSSQSPTSTSSLVTAGEGSLGNKRNSVSRARSSLGGYKGVTVEVRYDENGDGIGGGPSCSRRGSGTRGERNTIGRSGAGMTDRPMAFPPPSQEDG
ncbi:hypothetical protein I309_01820 [Cryptococcus deuterogattii LA55]|nr:hypothetical protein I309_01820 [Cryptococcus deuterogattii LA55]KIR71768.1 hypothetical protein I310_04448 [Cryptococcus deuterogattii CA1014]KIR91350.1 hypothetical protein I304_04821 [Cryptococcus deuterogattii CBS 10090]